MHSVLNWLVRGVIGRLVAMPVRRRLNAFERATHDPRTVQEALRRHILAAHAATGFGRDHHFAQTATVADFRNNVPVAGYEYVEPYMRRVVAGEWQALLASPKIHMFAMTSGTTAAQAHPGQRPVPR